MRRVLLILEPKERAIFTERAATEGVHRTRPHPTGASLLGWAARKLYEEFDSRGRAYHVFHSGKVRFTDALPLAHDGHVAFPMPKILVSEKSIESPFKDDKLLTERVWVGRAAFRADHGDGSQADTLKREFLTATLVAPELATGGRLRTATDEGRAREAGLFGYTHIDPLAGVRQEGRSEADVPARYAALIEGDLKNEDLDALKKAFAAPLLLGRAARTGYGGWYACTWKDEAELQAKGISIEPATSRAIVGVRDNDKGGVLVRVWLLSDVALLDQCGSPCFEPSAKLLGLPAGGVLVKHESAASTRRYAPWNGKLGCRDVERQAIAAGSVLTYRYETLSPDESAAGLNVVGLFREQGLGRLWIDPPMLRGAHPCTDDAVKPLAPELGSRSSAPAGIETPAGVAGWAKRMADVADMSAPERLAKEWIGDLDRLLRRAGGGGPSSSQWQEVANKARQAVDRGSILSALFDPPNAACGSEAASTRGGDWRKPLGPTDGGVQPTVRTWLRARIESTSEKLPVAHLKWMLGELARDRARKHRQEAEQRHG